MNSAPVTTPTQNQGQRPGEEPTQTSQPHPEMLVIPTTGTPYLTRSTAGQSIPQTISRIIGERTSFGLGILRIWHHDIFTGRAPNPTADWILPHLGYTHPTGWHGPVILTMEETPDGQIPPMPPHIVDALITRTS